MVQTINCSQFRDAFRSAGRAEQFSYEALGALFDYLEDFDGGGYDLDVIALCCDYAEDSAEDIAKNYNIEVDSLDALEDAVRAHLEENTSIVADLNGRFLYAQF